MHIKEVRKFEQAYDAKVESNFKMTRYKMPDYNIRYSDQYDYNDTYINSEVVDAVRVSIPTKSFEQIIDTCLLVFEYENKFNTSISNILKDFEELQYSSKRIWHEEKLRRMNPMLNDAYEQYRVLLKLCE